MSDELIELPEGWKWSNTSELCASVRDGTHDTPRYFDEGVPLVTSKNLRHDQIDFSTARNISFEDHQQISIRSGVEDGDVLFAMIGTIGNPVVVKKDREFSIKNIGLFKKNELVINSKFLKFWFSSYYFQKILDEQALIKGTTQKFVPLANLRIFPVPLPPLNQQKRIVAAIEALRERSQKARSVLSVIPELCDKFRQSVLAAAFRGDLTADWREQNPDVKAALEILSELQSTKRKQKNKTNTISSSFDIPFEAPETWEWIILDIICEKITDGEHLTPPLAEKGVPLLSAKDVRDWSLDFSNTKFVSSEVAEKSRARCNPEKNDVLVVSRGATVGRTSRVKTEEPFCLMGSVLLFKLNQSIIEPEFIELFFKSPFGARQLTSMSGASAQQAIYIRDMRSFPTPFPPLTEQKEIVRQVKTLFQFIDKIEESHEGTEAYLDRLNQSILAKAFRGELVDQDPNDEPASVLLKRIRVDREQQMQGKIKKPGKKKRTGD